jgi:hypothetical protein
MVRVLPFICVAIYPAEEKAKAVPITKKYVKSG